MADHLRRPAIARDDRAHRLCPLGLALTFSPPVYGYYKDLPDRLWGITARQDQNLGGILMSTEQAVVFFSAIVWLLGRLLREEAEAEERLAAEQRAAGLREH